MLGILEANNLFGRGPFERKAVGGGKMCEVLGTVGMRFGKDR